MTKLREIQVSLAILSITTIIDRYFIGVEAGTGCSSGVLLCHKPSEEMGYIELELDELEAERINIDVRLLGVAVPLIEEQLSRRGKKDDMHSNIREIERMISNEMDTKYLVNVHSKSKQKKPNCLSSRLDFHHDLYTRSDVMINALLRLRDLKRIDDKNLGCSAASTHDLAEVNLMARDPVGRRNRNETALFPRVDNMIVETALRRALHCFVYYRNALRQLPGFDGYKIMKMYWNRVFEHRIKKERPKETRKPETLFFGDPKGCFEFVQKMPHAIEEDEHYIARDLFANKDRESRSGDDDNRDNTDDKNIRNDEMSAYKRGVHKMVKLCKTFNFLVADVFASLEFDMQLKDLIPARLLDLVENDYMLNKQRSYQMMCQKLIHDTDRPSDSSLDSSSSKLAN